MTARRVEELRELRQAQARVLRTTIEAMRAELAYAPGNALAVPVWEARIAAAEAELAALRAEALDAFAASLERRGVAGFVTLNFDTAKGGEQHDAR